MSEMPGDLQYTKEHEWLRREDDASVTVGITDHAQSALGDLVYVELPEVGQELELDGEMAVVESVKAASDVYAPLSGSVLAVNEELADDPEKINTDPYGAGWISIIRPEDPDSPNRPLISGDEAMTAYIARIDEVDVSCFRCED